MAAAYDPPASDDRGPLVIRPSWRAGWDVAIIVLFIAGLLVGSFTLFARSSSLGTVVALIALGVSGFAIYAAYRLLYVLGSSITVTADSVVVTHWFRPTGRVACRDIIRVITLLLASGNRNRYTRRAVLAFSSDHRCVLSLYTERWSRADLDRIWRHLDVTPEVWNLSDKVKRPSGAIPGCLLALSARIALRFAETVTLVA